jgi:hypothetical protein
MCTLLNDEFVGKVAGDAYLGYDYRCRVCSLFAGQHPDVYKDEKVKDKKSGAYVKVAPSMSENRVKATYGLSEADLQGVHFTTGYIWGNPFRKYLTADVEEVYDKKGGEGSRARSVDVRSAEVRSADLAVLELEQQLHKAKQARVTLTKQAKEKEKGKEVKGVKEDIYAYKNEKIKKLNISKYTVNGFPSMSENRVKATYGLSAADLQGVSFTTGTQKYLTADVEEVYKKKGGEISLPARSAERISKGGRMSLNSVKSTYGLTDADLQGMYVICMCMYVYVCYM